MALKALGHRILLKVTIDKVTESGIVLAIDEKLHRTVMEEGVIVDIGPNAWKAFDGGEPWAKVNDRVIYSKYGGKFVVDPLTGEEYMVINDEDILCKVIKQDSNEDGRKKNAPRR